MQRIHHHLLFALLLMLAAAWPVACGGSSGEQGAVPDAGGAGGAADAAAGTGGSGGSAAAAGTGASGAGGAADAGVEASDAALDGYDDAAAVVPVDAKLIDPGLAIDRKGNIVGWGAGWDPAYTPSGWQLIKAPLGPFVATDGACGIRPTGKLLCWADEFYGPNPPLPAGLFSQISSGTAHACLLRLDGTVACYGDGKDPAGHTTCGQGGVGYSYDCGQSAPPPGTFIQVTAGWLFSCGIRTDGTIACWGLGQPGDICSAGPNCDPTYTQCMIPCWGTATPPAGTFVKMSTASSDTCAIRTDGTIACWGWRYDGEDGGGPGTDTGLIPSGTFIDVSDADASACAVGSDGSVVCWGYPNDPAVLSPPSGHFLQVGTDGWSACALRDDYAVLCWGSDKYGYVSEAPASL